MILIKKFKMFFTTTTLKSYLKKIKIIKYFTISIIKIKIIIDIMTFNSKVLTFLKTFVFLGINLKFIRK